MLAKSFSPLFQEALECLVHSEQTSAYRNGKSRPGRVERGWEAPQTEGRKACWSPKLQKLIGHARVGSHLHSQIVQEPRLRGIQGPLFSTSIPQKRHKRKRLAERSDYQSQAIILPALMESVVNLP